MMHRKIAGPGHLGWAPRGWQGKDGKHDDDDDEEEEEEGEEDHYER